MHTCPAPGCDEKVPYDQLACKAHWFTIPKPLRDELWRAYRSNGQGSDEHIAAMDACIEFLEQNIPDPFDAKVGS